jgi:hypothetical protein
MQSHFLILPTRADCFGVVFAEASSFGLPSLAACVWGVPTAIVDNAHGKTFRHDGIASCIREHVEPLMFKYTMYAELCESSFTEYSNRPNWSTAGRNVNRLIHEFCAD